MPVIGALRETFPDSVLYSGRDELTGIDCWFVGLKVPKQDIIKWDMESDKHGLNAKYYNGTGFGGKPVLTEKKQLIFYDWKSQPVASPSSAEWTGKIRIDSPGQYVFAVQTDNHAGLFIDGKEPAVYTGALIPAGQQGIRSVITLGVGYHAIRVRLSVRENYSGMSLWWARPRETEMKLVSPGVLYYN
jgi:hypothetical protein